MLVLQNMGLSNAAEADQGLAATSPEVIMPERLMNKYDLIFTFAEGVEALLLSIPDNPDIYDARRIEAMRDHCKSYFIPLPMTLRFL